MKNRLGKYTLLLLSRLSSIVTTQTPLGPPDQENVRCNYCLGAVAPTLNLFFLVCLQRRTLRSSAPLQYALSSDSRLQHLGQLGCLSPAPSQ